MIDKDRVFQELLALDAVSDDEIDSSEIPIRTDFAGGAEGRFYHLLSRGYDVRAIANWCIRKAQMQSKKITNLWLNKIVYLIYEESIKTKHILLTSAVAEAWDHGPVFREIYFGLSNENVSSPLKTFDPQTRQKVEASEDFDPSDLDLFENVWSRFSKFSGSQLRAITHKEGEAWYRVWHYAGVSNPGMKIDVATIIGASNSDRTRND